MSAGTREDAVCFAWWTSVLDRKPFNVAGFRPFPDAPQSPITFGAVTHDNWALLNQVPGGNISIRSPCRGAHDVDFLISGARAVQGGA
jgi:hypothetical protein